MSSRHILSAGIFSSEPGQRLLSICETLTRRAFQGLYAKCKDNVQGSYYQTGLKRVHVWSDTIVNEDIDFVRNTCPDIDETYEMCFVHYVEERFRGNRRPVIHCPALLKFVRRFLESVALHEHLQTAEFFTTRDVVQKRITCMDACRQAFYSLVNADSVRVEMESTVSRGTAPPSEVSIARAPPKKSEEEVVLESEEPEILPSDSISQIDVPRSVASQTFDEEPLPHADPLRGARRRRNRTIAILPPLRHVDAILVVRARRRRRRIQLRRNSVSRHRLHRRRTYPRHRRRHVAAQTITATSAASQTTMRCDATNPNLSMRHDPRYARKSADTTLKWWTVHPSHPSVPGRRWDPAIPVCPLA